MYLLVIREARGSNSSVLPNKRGSDEASFAPAYGLSDSFMILHMVGQDPNIGTRGRLLPGENP